MAAALELWQQLVEEHHLSARLHALLVVLLVRRGALRDALLRPLDGEGVVAALSQFHHHVHEGGGVGRLDAAGEKFKVALVNGPVELLLARRQFHLDDGFCRARTTIQLEICQGNKHELAQSEISVQHERPFTKKYIRAISTGLFSLKYRYSKDEVQ